MKDFCSLPIAFLITVFYTAMSTVAFAQTAGTLDATFGGGNGYATNSISGISFAGKTDERASSIAVQSDGKIVIGGYNGVISSTSNGVFAVARYNADGTLDSMFATNGTARTSITPKYDQANAIVIHPDGKIVAGGCSATRPISSAYSQFAIVR